MRQKKPIKYSIVPPMLRTDFVAVAPYRKTGIILMACLSDRNGDLARIAWTSRKVNGFTAKDTSLSDFLLMKLSTH